MTAIILVPRRKYEVVVTYLYQPPLVIFISLMVCTVKSRASHLKPHALPSHFNFNPETTWYSVLARSVSLQNRIMLVLR